MANHADRGPNVGRNRCNAPRRSVMDLRAPIARKTERNKSSDTDRPVLLFRVLGSGSPLQWPPDRREDLIFSVMPCISERRPLSDTIGAAFVIRSRDDPFVVPADNCHREAAEVPAS